MSAMLFSNQYNQQIQPQTKTNSIKQMMQMVKSNANPSAVISELAKQNPQIQETINMINTQYGGDAKAAFMASAKQKGANPNDIINSLIS